MVAATCLAMNVYMEARSEPVSGQRAVAQVTVRRAGLGSGERSGTATGTGACRAVTRRSQFSWTAGVDGNGRVWDEGAWQLAQRIAREALLWGILHHTPDHSNGATHYATRGTDPWWAEDMEVTAEIGNHIFYRAR